MRCRRLGIGTAAIAVGLLFSTAPPQILRAQSANAPGTRWAEIQPSERLAGRRALVGRATGTPKVAAEDGDFVVLLGSEHPDLFFRWELFQRLMLSGFGPLEQRAPFRRDVESRASSAGLAAPDWEKLERAAKPWLASVAAQRRAAAGLDALDPGAREERLAAIRSMQANDCSMRAQALAAAERALTRPSLDRLLFEAVAPGVAVTTLAKYDTLEHHRFIEGGCR